MQAVGEGLKFEFSNGGEVIADKFECLRNNKISNNQEVKFNPECGLGRSAETVQDIYKYLAKHPNVRCTFGVDGAAVAVKRYSNGDVGVVAESGNVHSASTVLLAMGSNTGSVIDLQNQQAATGLFVTHIQLSESEFEIYKDMPILFDAEMGYFFPPDPKTRILKICTSGGGIKRVVEDPFNHGSKVSLPRFHDSNPKDTIPKNRVPEIRKLLKKYVPALKSHKLFGSRVCWIGDKENSHFLIDKVPNFTNLYVSTGDSGHGYKFFPNIGKYIVQMINSELDSEIKDVWKWQNKSNEELYDPANASWRISRHRTRDITEIKFVAEKESWKL